MADFGITYHQVKSAEGPYIFRMEPDLDALAQFPGYTGVTLSYFGRQLVAREVELERIHRSTPKAIEQNDKSHTRTDKKPQERKPTAKPNTNATSPTDLPNHLQRLKPKRIESSKAASETVSSSIDFIHSIQHQCTFMKKNQLRACHYKSNCYKEKWLREAKRCIGFA